MCSLSEHPSHRLLRRSVRSPSRCPLCLFRLRCPSARLDGRIPTALSLCGGGPALEGWRNSGRRRRSPPPRDRLDAPRPSCVPSADSACMGAGGWGRLGHSAPWHPLQRSTQRRTAPHRIGAGTHEATTQQNTRRERIQRTSVTTTDGDGRHRANRERWHAEHTADPRHTHRDGTRKRTRSKAQLSTCDGSSHRSRHVPGIATLAHAEQQHLIKRIHETEAAGSECWRKQGK